MSAKTVDNNVKGSGQFLKLTHETLQRLLRLSALATLALLALLSYSSSAEAAGSCEAGWFADGPFCYSCGGYDRTATPITDEKSCSKWIQPHTAMARQGTAGLQFICPAGQWPWGGGCYACPGGGWLRNPFVAPPDRNACWKVGYTDYKKAVKASKPYCGFNGGRACNVWEAMPSCGPGLFEHKAKCEPVPPGKSPFLASIEIWSKETVAAGKQACTSAIMRQPGATPFPLIKLSSDYQIQQAANKLVMSVNQGTQDAVECGKNYEAGFVCEIPGLLSSVGNMAEMMDRFGHAFDKPPCTVYRDANAPTLQLACAVAEGLGIESAVNLAKCAYDVLSKKPTNSNESKSAQLQKMCRASGQLTFKVAEFFAGREMAKALEAAPASRINTIATTLKQVYDTMGLVTTVESIKDGIATVPSCKVFNDPDPSGIGAQKELPVAEWTQPTQVARAPAPVTVPYVPMITEHNSIVQFRNVGDSLCLTQASTDRTQSYLRQCDNGSEPQTWVVERREGFFTLRSQHSWQCLTHSGGGTQPGYTTVQSQCNLKDANQRWALRPAHGFGNAITISPYNKRSLCLNTSRDSVGRVPFVNCNAADASQRWQMNSYGNLERAMLQFEQDNRCMAQGGSFEDGRQVFQWDCGNGYDSSNWTWMREPYPGQPGFFYLRSETSGKCLDLSGHKSDNGTPILQWQCAKNNAGQIWELAQVNGSQFPLQLRTYLYQDWNPRRCVTLKGNGKGNNTVFHEWGCSGPNDHGQYGKNDKFRLLRVTNKRPLWVEWTSTKASGIDISIGGGKAWVIGTDRKVYEWTGSGWQHRGGDGIARIDVGPDGNPVVIDANNSILGWDPARKGFVQLPGKAIDITIGADNRMYMINAGDKQVYEWNSGTKAWQPAGLRNIQNLPFTNIDADGFGNLWALDARNVFYKLRDGQSSIPGLAEPLASSIGTSPDGAVWGTGIDGSVVQWVDDVAKELPAFTNGMKFIRIEGSERGWVWAIRDNGEIFYGEVL